MRPSVRNSPVGNQQPGKLKDRSRNDKPYLSGSPELEEILNSPSLRAVLDALHKFDDLDADGAAHHHTLGLRADQALPGSYGSVIFRVGEIRFFAVAGDYGGFLRCDGASYNRSDFPHLSQYLGGGGATFNVPTVTLTGTVPY